MGEWTRGFEGKRNIATELEDFHLQKVLGGKIFIILIYYA